jgi:hypothetical protein
MQADIQELRDELASTNNDIRVLREESSDNNYRIRRMERMMHAMCEQNSINLSAANIGDLANPATTLETPSPLTGFRSLAISRGRSGGRASAGSSAHSSARSIPSVGKSSLTSMMNNIFIILSACPFAWQVHLSPIVKGACSWGLVTFKHVLNSAHAS